MKLLKENVIRRASIRPKSVIGRLIRRILAVLSVERVHSGDDLGEIVFCLRLSGLVLNSFESGKEKTDQNDNDCDDDEQLDESERAFVFLGWMHGANATRKLARPHVKSLKKLHRYNA